MCAVCAAILLIHMHVCYMLFTLYVVGFAFTHCLRLRWTSTMALLFIFIHLIFIVLRNLTHIYHAIILFYSFLYTKLSLLNCDICHIFLFTISQIIPFYSILYTKFLNGSIFGIPPKYCTFSHSFLSHFIYKAIIPFYVFQRTNIPFIYKSTFAF